MTGVRVLRAACWVLVGGLAAAAQPCRDVVSVSLANGTRAEDGSVHWDGLSFPPWAQYCVDGELRGCPCLLRKCIRRCCRPGEFNDRRTCHKPWNASYGIRVPPLPEGVLDTAIRDIDEYFYVIYGPSCLTASTYALTLSGRYKKPADSFAITAEGIMVLSNEKDNTTNEYRYDQERYCMAWSELSNSTKFVVCPGVTENVLNKINDAVTWMHSIGNWLSSIFLILTIVVYSLFPELRNLHGMTLMVYSGCLAVACAFVTIIRHGAIQNNLLLTRNSCRGIGSMGNFVIGELFSTFACY